MPFMTKTLRQAIMLRSKLFHTFTRSKNQMGNFRKQCNHCVKLRNKADKTSRTICTQTKSTRITFGKHSDPSLRTKRLTTSLSDDRGVAKIFMKYFSTITKTTDISKYDPIDKEFLSITDPVLRAIGKYKDHPLIARINSLTKNKMEFNFKYLCP